MSDETPVLDPSVHEPELKLTRTEWTLYWKAKYESSIARVVEASKFIDKAKAHMTGLVKENTALKKRAGDLEEQLRALQAERQAAAAKEGGVPAVKRKPRKR